MNKNEFPCWETRFFFGAQPGHQPPGGLPGRQVARPPVVPQSSTSSAKLLHGLATRRSRPLSLRHPAPFLYFCSHGASLS